MSDGFSADWLALREPLDAAACDPALLERLAAWRRRRGWLHVVDLGAGTGANLRRTAPRLGGDQSWTLVEWDAGLIAAGAARLASAGVAWRYRRLDLAQDLERLGDGPCDLITASALLDLVSSDWLTRLAALCRRTGAALYVALSYDGRIAWDPLDPDDARVVELVNVHQRSDKGLGPACGPDAVGLLVERLDAGPGEIVLGRSDWMVGEEALLLQAEMVRGHLAAATGMAPEQSTVLNSWAERRLRWIDEGRSQLRVGHADLLQIPAAPAVSS